MEAQEERQKRNEELYPEAWEFFIEQARNIEKEPDLKHLGKYRIPKPDMSGDFIYANHPGVLFCLMRDQFYKPAPNSHSVYGKIQYIVQNF